MNAYVNKGHGNLPLSQRLGARVTYAHLLAAIMLAGIALRLASAIFQGNAVTALPGIYDQISYDGLARRVIAGHGFSFAEAHWPATRAGEPTAHWSYLYTLYLSAVYWMTGAQPVVARIAQAVVAGALHTWLTWRIGSRIFGSAAGMAAAGITAVYIYFVYYAGALITETFYIIGALWVFDCALRLHRMMASPAQSGAWRLWLELGLALGLTVLLRQVFLLFSPFVYAWLWWAMLHQKPYAGGARMLQAGRLLRGTLLSAAVVAMLVVPWTVRNQRAFDTFVPLNTNSGYAFFWGNHPIYGTRFVGILPGEGAYYDLIPPELLSLNEAELDRALLKRGMQFVFDDPVRYALLSASRTREYFKFWPSGESGMMSNVSRVGSFGLALPFMLYGLWLAARLAWRSPDPFQRAAIVLLLGFCVVYSGIHLLTWALIRYRLPVDAVLIVFAGYAIAILAGRAQAWLAPA